MIAKRVAKAAYEMTFAPEFDVVIVNDILDRAKEETERIITEFIALKIQLVNATLKAK
jgi:guanylate kinase